MKKALIYIAVCGVGFFISPIVGLAVTTVMLIIGLYKFLPTIYSMQGNKAFSEGRQNDSIKWYKKAAATGRASDAVMNGYGMVLLRCGFPEDAERVFDSIVCKKSAKAEDKNRAKQYRTLCYYKEGRMDEALEDAKELFMEYRTTVNYGIMGLFMALSDTPNEELLKFCIEAYEYNCDDRDIADNLVVAHLKCGQYDAASALCANITENHPQFVEGFYHGAIAEKNLGNNEKAKEYLDKISDCKRTFMTTVSEEEIESLRQELVKD